MSTYRKIHGRSIQAVTTDPTGDVAEGQIWYNTTSDTFKSVLTQESWVASNKMNTPRATMAGGSVGCTVIQRVPRHRSGQQARGAKAGG